MSVTFVSSGKRIFDRCVMPYNCTIRILDSYHVHLDERTVHSVQSVCANNANLKKSP